MFSIELSLNEIAFIRQSLDLVTIKGPDAKFLAGLQYKLESEMQQIQDMLAAEEVKKQQELEELVKQGLKPNRAVVILGARRVGKTELIKNLLSNWDEPYLLLNGDDQMVQDLLVSNNKNNKAFQEFFLLAYLPTLVDHRHRHQQQLQHMSH
jgi:hypothetical protein